MSVHHWNVAKVDTPSYGMARYEDALAENIRGVEGPPVTRIKRSANTLFGAVPVAWLYQYRSPAADLVHATFQTVAPAALLHRPATFVVTVHDLAPLVYPSERSDASVRLQWALTPRALERADRLIAISEFTKQELTRLTDVSASDVDVVPQGVDHDHYRPMETAACRRRLGLDEEATYVLVVSSNVAHKRVEIARDVIERVRADHPGAKLLKAGYGEELTGKHVVSTGWVPEADMPALYNAADVYLHPSEYEGFGLPVLEAMACGVPVVARDVASIPEIVGDTYELASDDATPSEFASLVSAQIDQDADGTGLDRSREFSWQRTAEETIAVYEELLK